MANYVSALGKLAAEKTSSAVSGFARGAKGAFMSEVPGITSAAAFASTLKRYSSAKEKEANTQNETVKEQRTNNVISLDMARQLRAINSSIIAQTRLAANADRRAAKAEAFAEETEKEKILRDQKLLDAIKDLKKSIENIDGTGNGSGGGLKFKKRNPISDFLKDHLNKILAGLGALGLGKALGNRIPGGGPKAPPPSTPDAPNKQQPAGNKPVPVPGAPPGAPGAPGGPKPSTPQTPPGSNKPPGNVIDIKTGKPIPSPPEMPKGGGILKGLGSVGRVLGWAGLAIGGILELPGFIEDIKSISKGENTRVGNDPDKEKPIGDRTRKDQPPPGPGFKNTSPNTSVKDFIRKEEGKRLEAYKDAGGYAIGYGKQLTNADMKRGYMVIGGRKVDVSGGKKNAAEIRAGSIERFTDEHAEILLNTVLKEFEAKIIRAVGEENWNKLNENQKAAILSYTYNVGSPPSAWVQSIKSGESIENQAKAIENGVRTSQGQVLDGLVKRRKKEAELYLSGQMPTSGNLSGNYNFKGDSGQSQRFGGPRSDNASGDTLIGGLGNDTLSGGGGGDSITPKSTGAPIIPVVPAPDTGDETERLAARYPNLAATSGANFVDFASSSGTITPNTKSDQVAEAIIETEKNTRKLVRQGNNAEKRALQAKRDNTRAAAVGRGSQRSVITDPVQRYYQQRITSLTQQFENTTRRLINTSLTELLFPGKFFGVSRKQAERPGYLGNLIGKELQIQKKITPFFNKLVGKKYGGQYASIFGQAGNLLVDKGVNFLGSMLPFQNNAFSFQQIAGNLLTKGKKGKEARKLGIEQLIYGMTGIPIGAQSGLAFVQQQFPSLFGKNAGGYMTPQQQVAALSNTLTGGMMGFLQPGMLFNQGLSGAMNMIPGRQVSGIAGQPSGGGLLDFIFGPSRSQTQDDNIYGYAPVGTNTGQGPGFFSTLATNISNFFKPTSYNGEKVASGLAASQKIAVNSYDEFYSGIGDSVAEGQTGAFAGLGSIFAGGFGFLSKVFDGVGGGLGNILNWGFNLLASLFSGTGGGTGGGLFGGGGEGGFFSDLGKAWSGEMSWGDALLNTGMKIGGNLATNYAAYQITKNIKNPYVKLAAQQGVNYALKSGLQFAGSSLGFGDITAKFLGKDTGLTTALKTGDFSSLNPFNNAGSSAGYNAAGEAGLRTGVNLTMPGGGGGISTTPNMDIAGTSDFGGMDINASMGGGAAPIVEGTAVPVSDILGSGYTNFASGGFSAGTTGGLDALGEGGGAASATSGILDNLPGVGDVLPYAGAIVKLFQGDIKGAAISAGATYAVNAIAQYLNIGFPGLGLVAGFIANALIGKADPRCTWAIYVNGNSDPSAGSIISEGKKTPGSMKDATTKIGIMLFAMLKKAQITVNGPLAYDYFTISMHGKSKTSTVGVGKGEFKEKGNKEVITVSLDEISTAQGLNKVTQALMNAMLEETSAEKKSSAIASAAKLTKPELESGVVAGAGEEFKGLGGTTFANKFERDLNQQYREGGTRTVDTGEGSYTENLGPRSVWNEKLGKVVEESNPLIMGYNKEGQAVDLKGNVVDFSAFSTAAGFKDSFAIQEAYTDSYTSGEDSYSSYHGRQVFNAKTGKFQDEDNPNIIGYDRQGNPIKPGADAAVAAMGTALPVTSGTSLSFQQQQATNDALKNSNPTTATNTGDTAAVVNSGNQINNSTNTTVVNTSLRDEGFMFGATRRSEFAIIPGIA
jgi:GH24 family phage-related lysozyme (muramidase)